MNDNPSVETLFRQASMTAHTYFNEAIQYIDERFGEGYAEAHPSLIGAFMQAAALDFQAGIIATRIDAIGQRIEDALSSR